MSEWQKLRTRLNHDWLKNEYTKNLDALILRLAQYQSIDSTTETEILAYLFDWKEKYKDIDRLLNTAEDSLSPRTLFDKEPLALCLSEYKTWLIPLVHGIWLTHSDIRNVVLKAKRKLSKADQSYAYLDSVISEQRDGNIIRKALEHFTDRVSDLSLMISTI